MRKSPVRRSTVVRLAGAVALTAVLSLAGSSARAATVTATLDSISPKQTVGLTYNGTYLGLGYAGTLNWHVTADDGTGLSGNFSAFCVDPLQDVMEGESHTFTGTDLEHDADPQWPVAPVGATGLDAVHVGYLNNLYSTQYASIGTDADRSAAFQLAIWELLYDNAAPGAHDVTTGGFSVKFASEAVVNLTNQFVAGATSTQAAPFSSPLLVLTSPTAQDQLYVGAPLPGSPVPTPAAALGAVPLLGALVLAQRARRRRIV